MLACISQNSRLYRMFSRKQAGSSVNSLLSLKSLMGDKEDDKTSADSSQYCAIQHQNDQTTHGESLKVLLED